MKIQRRFYFLILITLIRLFLFFSYLNSFFSSPIGMISWFQSWRALKVSNFPTIIWSMISLLTFHVTKLNLWETFQEIYDEFYSLNQRRNGIEITTLLIYTKLVSALPTLEGTFRNAFSSILWASLSAQKAPRSPGKDESGSRDEAFYLAHIYQKIDITGPTTTRKPLSVALLKNFCTLRWWKHLVNF